MAAKTKTQTKLAVVKATRAREKGTIGESIIAGLKEAIAWTDGRNDKSRQL